MTRHVNPLPEAMPLDVKQTVVASLATTLELLDARGADVDDAVRYEAARQTTQRALDWVLEQPVRLEMLA